MKERFVDRDTDNMVVGQKLNKLNQTCYNGLAQLSSQLPSALVSGRLNVSIGASPATVPISAVALPLPTGAATSQLQSSGSQKTQITNSAGTAVEILDEKLRTLSMRYTYGIAEGIVPNHVKGKVIGFRSALSTTESHLALGATGRFVWPTVAQVFYLSSSSASDDGSPAGTGAQTVLFAGLDASGVMATETVVLNGVTQVATVGTYLAPCINDTYVNAAGSTGSNVGTITCHSATPGTAGTVVWAMGPTTNQAQGSVFRVPTGKVGYMIKVVVGESSTQGVVFRFYARLPGGLMRKVDSYQVDGNMFFDEFLIPPKYPAGTQIEMTAQANSGTAIVSCKMVGWIENA